MPPPSWNNQAPRAVVLPVLPPTDPDARSLRWSTPYAVLASPGVVGVGIYALDSAVPVRYAPHGFNSRVPEGWYAPRLKAGTRFVVVVTPMPHALAKVRAYGANMLVVDVSVAGSVAHPPGRMLDLNAAHEYVVRGFTLAQRYEGGRSLGVHSRHVAPFLFTDEDIVVRVSLRIAEAWKFRRPKPDLEERAPDEAGPVAGSPVAIRRYTHKEVPKLKNIRAFDGVAISVHLVNHKWLTEHNVFHRNELEPCVWLDSNAKHYLTIETILPQENAEPAHPPDADDNDSVDQNVAKD